MNPNGSQTGPKQPNGFQNNLGDAQGQARDCTVSMEDKQGNDGADEFAVEARMQHEGPREVVDGARIRDCSALLRQYRHRDGRDEENEDDEINI